MARKTGWVTTYNPYTGRWPKPPVHKAHKAGAVTTYRQAPAK